MYLSFPVILATKSRKRTGVESAPVYATVDQNILSSRLVAAVSGITKNAQRPADIIRNESSLAPLSFFLCQAIKEAKNETRLEARNSSEYEVNIKSFNFLYFFEGVK